ncbi:MAG: hypothetical protein ACYDAJ_06305 [Nitrosotalea sp.]
MVWYRTCQNMKTLGASLIVLGLLVTLLGYGLHESYTCHCVSQTGGTPIGCHCTNTLQQSIGNVLVYAGLAIAGSGMIMFTMWWRKKIVFN